jgi:hypothetical protein
LGISELESTEVGQIGTADDVRPEGVWLSWWRGVSRAEDKNKLAEKTIKTPQEREGKLRAVYRRLCLSTPLFTFFFLLRNFCVF